MPLRYVVIWADWTAGDQYHDVFVEVQKADPVLVLAKLKELSADDLTRRGMQASSRDAVQGRG